MQALLGALGALRIPVTPELGIGVYREGSRVGIGAIGSIDIHSHYWPAGLIEDISSTDVGAIAAL